MKRNLQLNLNSMLKQDRPIFNTRIAFPEQLPITSHLKQIQSALQFHQVIIVVGETGSGKTTQLPKMCLEIGRGLTGVIAHTQPRRLAAKGVAARLQEELGHAEAVGVKIRFDDKTSSENYIQVMTDGLLLNQMSRDPLLKDFDTLIIDEAHERSLNIDFLLGLVKLLLSKRPEFRLIVTSATIQHHLFSQFFQNAPVFLVSGRTYPVDIRYLGPDSWGAHDQDLKVSAVIQALIEIYMPSLSSLVSVPRQNEKIDFKNKRIVGLDTLVFLPGERAIHDVSQAINRVFANTFDVLPLYARLASSSQSKIFSTTGRVRIVLATNLAETSITVPRIGYVVDSGLARISRYSQRRKVQLLPIEAISRASAAQRAGRCGRVAPGVCYRLYEQSDFENRPEFPEAEIHRTHLAGVILQMKAMQLPEPEHFPFIEPPAQKMINDGYQLLEELGAVADRALTSLGRVMSKLPLDPRIARLISSSEQCLYEMLIIASALSVMDVIEVPQEARDIARTRHGPYESKESDFVTLVILWHRLEWHRRHLTRRLFKEFCEKNFISLTRYYEWRDVHKQLKLLLSSQDVQPKTQWALYLAKTLINNTLVDPLHDWQINFTQSSNAALHKSLIAAFATQVAMSDSDSGGYMSCRQRLCFVHPSSRVKIRNQKSKTKSDQRQSNNNLKNKTTKQKSPEWILVGEFVETQKLWARQIAKIQIDWVLPQVRHLLKYEYSEPNWSKKMGAVVAQRTSRLFGLVLKQKELMLYKDIDRGLCRTLFIQTALVEQQLGESRYDASLTEFMNENQLLIEEIEGLEAKARTSGLMVSDQDIYDFFEEIIPKAIIDRESFFTWWKKERQSNPVALIFPRDWLLKSEQAANAYPRQLTIGGDIFELQYHFEPGHPDDGVTIIVPEAKLYDIQSCVLDWLVPGLIAEKCEALIRGLPKQDRKKFVPVPQFVRHFLEAGFSETEPLTLCMELFLERLSGYKSIDLSWPTLGGHLVIKIKVINAIGGIISQGTSLVALKSQNLARDLYDQASFKNAQPVNQQVISSVIPKDLAQPKVLRISHLKELPPMLMPIEGTSPLLYSTLGEFDTNNAVSVIQIPDPHRAEYLLHEGILNLLVIQMNALVKNLKRSFLKDSNIQGMISTFANRDLKTKIQNVNDFFWHCFMRSLIEQVFMQQPLPLNEIEAQEFLKARVMFVPFAEKSMAGALQVSKRFQGLHTKIKFLQQESIKSLADQDLLEQCEQILSFRWLEKSGPKHVQTWPVLVECLAHRFEKRIQRGGKDDAEARRVLALSVRLQQQHQGLEQKPLKLSRLVVELEWMLQILRAGVFAQHLKLPQKVSFKMFESKLTATAVELRKNS